LEETQWFRLNAPHQSPVSDERHDAQIPIEAEDADASGNLLKIAWLPDSEVFQDGTDIYWARSRVTE